MRPTHIERVDVLFAIVGQVAIDEIRARQGRSEC